MRKGFTDSNSKEMEVVLRIRVPKEFDGELEARIDEALADALFDRGCELVDSKEYRDIPVENALEERSDLETLEAATFVSVWDGGVKVETACKVNRETGEVFDIEVSDVDADGLEVLDEEYVRFGDGTEISVIDSRLVAIEDTLLDIESIRDYMHGVRLGDYDLDGCEITEDDLYTIRERVNDSGSSLDEVVHGYLLEIREVLDAGLDSGDVEAEDAFPLRYYDEAARYLCEVLNQKDDELDLEGNKGDFLKIAEFIPIFKSENFFGIYVWHNDSNEYYLVNRNNGAHEMVLGDSFEFVGRNTLDCMKGEQVLHVASTEWLRYLVDFSLENVKNIQPEPDLRGIAVLESALREAVQKEGKYMMGVPLMERIEAAQRAAQNSNHEVGHRENSKEME